MQSQFERSLKGLPCFLTQHAQLSKNITSIRKHDMKLKLLRSPRRVKCLNTEHGVHGEQDANEVWRKRQIFQRTWTLLSTVAHKYHGKSFKSIPDN